MTTTHANTVTITDLKRIINHEIDYSTGRPQSEYWGYYDGEFIGVRSTYSACEKMLDEYVYDLLSDGLLHTATELDGGTYDDSAYATPEQIAQRDADMDEWLRESDVTQQVEQPGIPYAADLLFHWRHADPEIFSLLLMTMDAAQIEATAVAFTDFLNLRVATKVQPPGLKAERVLSVWRGMVEAASPPLRPEPPYQLLAA